MHASEIVLRFADAHLWLMHAARCRVFCAAVTAAMCGHCLSLSRLSRGLRGHGTFKSAIKRVDRLIGNPRIADEAKFVGGALLGVLSRMSTPLVIAVDWSSVNPGGTFVELRAVVTRLGMGRGLTVYQQVYPQSKLGNVKAERKLLKTLHALVPAGTSVTVVTDAGFRGPWFTQVARLGWAWLGRVRRPGHVSRDGKTWLTTVECFGKATGQAIRWADCQLTRASKLPSDLVLVRRRVRGGKRYRCPGHGSTNAATRKAKVSAHEPWLLAHSPSLRELYRADEIVALYARRMQIEENFRDTKSQLYGMGSEIGRSRSASRLHALLLIANLAAFLLWHIGQLAEAEGVHCRFKATTRKARELSIVALALMLCASHSALTWLSTDARRTLYRRLEMRP